MKRLSFTLAAVLLAVGWPSMHAQDAAQAQKLFASARHLETTQGDLRAAIETYQKVVAQAGANRSLAAQALLRIGECHTKLGDAQARQAYERLVRDYGDTPEAKTARARIGAAGAATARTAAATDRIVKAGEEVTWGDGRVSPDGRYISWTHWNGGGNLMLHDLATGVDRNLTGNKDWSVGNAYSSAFSPDGRQLAFGWRTYRTSTRATVNELRLMTLDGSAAPPIRVLYANPDVNVFEPVDWSADGRWLLVLMTRRDQSRQIALVGAADGVVRPLKTIGWRGADKGHFSPDSRYVAYDLPASETGHQRDVFVMAIDGSRETCVVESPADDRVMGWSANGHGLLFSSDRSGKVGLYAVPMQDGRVAGLPSMLKPDIGSSRSVGLTAAGVLHIVRDASTESMQIAPIDLRAGRLAGPLATENVRSKRPDWSASGRLLAYASTTVSGATAVTVRSVASGEVRQLIVAMSYINEPRWLADERTLVTFGRDYKGRAGVYQIDAQTGAHSFIAEALLSRVQVSPDGRRVYYPTVGHNATSPVLIEHDMISGQTRELRGPQGPMDWALSPDGQTLAFTVRSGAVAMSAIALSSVREDGTSPRHLDTPFRPWAFGHMSWTADGKAVVLQADDAGKAVWLVPVDGTAARKLDVDASQWNLGPGMRLHPQSTHIAFFTGKDAREVWALESVAQR
jgi:Tol biopolymer transport system component